MVGKSLGHYEIRDVLGRGGMGVVYKAEDSRLKRPVALKLLTAAGFEDEEIRLRFLQEAQAAAALEHPNICGVYEVGEHDGSWFIAMPYLEGRSLDERIRSGPLPIPEVVEIARQVAEALEEAHAKEIVHRDIKPANIMVNERERRRLQVTLMDFGLARVSQSTRLTRVGSQMGTAAYMSPEQTLGSAVDRRSDIWSLGVVLYEMTVGQLPFPSDYEQAIFYGIQNEDPESLTGLRSGVPMELERIVAKCLAKDPDERYQSCPDLLVDLSALARSMATASSRDISKPASAPASPAVEAESVPVARRLSPAQAGVAACAAAGVAFAVAWFLTGGGSASDPSPVAPMYEFSRVTWDGDLNGFPALSPDGSLLAYSSDRAGNGDLDIWVRQVGGGGLIRVTDHPADEILSDFSPDGQRLAFYRTGEGVMTIPAIGGEPFLVAAGAYNAIFSPDGTHVAYVKPQADGVLWFSPISTMEPRAVFRDFRRIGPYRWSPDGQAIISWSVSPAGVVDWWAAPVDGGEPQPTGARDLFVAAGLRLPVEPWSGVNWARSGNSAVIELEAELYISQISDDGLTFGRPVRLTAGAGIEILPAAAETGLLAFTNARYRRDIWSLEIDPGAKADGNGMRRVTLSDASDSSGHVSDDASRLVYVSERWGRTDVWSKDLFGGQESNVTNDPAVNGNPVLSPDGSRIAYWIREEDATSIVVVPFAGGAGRTVCEDCGVPRDWTPDGRFLLTSERSLQGGASGDASAIASEQSASFGGDSRIFLVSAATGSKSLLAGTEGALISRPAISRDGRWLAFKRGSLDNNAAIVTSPFSATGSISPDDWNVVVEGNDADHPVWSPDGSRVYYVSSATGSPDLWMVRLDSSKRAVSEPTIVRRFPTVRHSLHSIKGEFRLSLGGQRLFFPVNEFNGHIWLMEPRY